jgi:chromosome segregation protein
MRIKRLDITGFKSFMDRVVFSFDDGITGVVGPNGCGKSNVVDAIRWVMGEQSAKNLRGRGMEDVIFNGSETHAPLSMAEVTLTFAVGSADVLPETLAGLPEVSVTRRLFRSGESEYQINKTTCRLLDITELFLGTGVGTKAYSIIEQGRVGQIVSARPEDRRAFIEEAAGITKYKARRRAAERKMEYTQQNLTRVNDVVVELEKRLDALERQAKKAEKYKRLKGELRDIELHASAHRALELQSQRSVLQQKLASLSGDERGAYETVQRLEASIAERRTSLDTEATDLEKRAAELYALEAQVQLDAQNVAHWNEDISTTEARLAQLEVELKDVFAKKAGLDEERILRLGELDSLGVASKDDEVTLTVREEELRRSQHLIVELTARIEQERAELMALTGRVANSESALSGIAQRQADLAVRMERLSHEAAELKTEEKQLEAARKEVLERVEASRQLALELSSRRGEEETSLDTVREAFLENEVLVTALREELADKRSRLQTFEEIARHYEGFDRGVRAVMQHVGEGKEAAGVFGLVSELLDTNETHEKAIEAALGQRLQHVVVESTDKALELVGHLKALAEGRSSFVPVATSEFTPKAPVEGDGVLGMARTLVTAKTPALAGLVDRFLDGVVIVSELERAQTLRMLMPDYTFVTIDGDVLSADGTVTGGVMEGAGSGALQKRREIAVVAADVARLEERYNERITRHYELQKSLSQHEGVLKGLEKNRHTEELSLQSHEKDLAQAGTGLSKLRERIAGVGAELEQLSGLGATLALDLESARGEAAHGQTDRDARAQRLDEMSRELEQLQMKSEGMRAEATALKVKVASSSERGDAARRAADAIDDQLLEFTERAGRLKQSTDEAQTRLSELKGRAEETAAGRQEREAVAAEAQGVLAQAKAAHAEMAELVKGEEASLKEARATLDASTHGLSSLALEEKSLSMETDHLAQQLFERHAVTLAHAIHQFHLSAPLSDERMERLKELKAQLERMGEVNVSAIDEHHEVKERFTFLSTQKKDLEDSLTQLKEAIETIDETSRARFKETFDIVNEKFQAIFPRLFGGGRASLLLTNEGPGQEPGLEILAQPPGKKLQSVNLFSGGEKALTAVALIFGIFLIKPTPFCLLDEVDAPLDEGNVGRYNEMVREMSQASQFILITHNKRTMEVADTLYGVTMEEPGVSKLVSVKLKALEAANSDVQVA